MNSNGAGIPGDMSDDSRDRVGVLSHAIAREDLKPGDHVYVYRPFYTYAHHGIYTGIERQEIIHFSGPSKCDAKISAATINEFCRGGTIRLVAYGIRRNSLDYRLKRPGTVHSRKSLVPEEVVNTASKWLNHPELWDRYDLVSNNCEDFAYFCKTGHHMYREGQASVLKMSHTPQAKGIDISKPCNCISNKACSSENFHLHSYASSAESDSSFLTSPLTSSTRLNSFPPSP